MANIKNYMSSNIKVKMISAIILAGGKGSRISKKIPKQFLLLNKKKIYEYSLEIFLKNKNIDEIILVCHKNWINKIKINNKIVKIVTGGTNRLGSVYSGLKKCNPCCEKVIIHDAARPFISDKIINEGVSHLNKFEAAVPTTSINDSIIEIDQTINYLDRKKIKKIQTPQFFIFTKIINAYKNNKNNFKDDLSLILDYDEHTSFKLFEGNENNFKITTLNDYEMAKKMLH